VIGGSPAGLKGGWVSGLPPPPAAVATSLGPSPPAAVSTSPGPPELGWALVAAIDLPDSDRASPLFELETPAKELLGSTATTAPVSVEKVLREAISVGADPSEGANWAEAT